jgi:hypothetical protein
MAKLNTAEWDEEEWQREQARTRIIATVPHELMGDVMARNGNVRNQYRKEAA